MGLFDFLNNKNNHNTNSFDEYCENCGELLEDCECDDAWLSKQDISQDYDDIEYLELVDVFDEED